jgi:hypothetical protein
MEVLPTDIVQSILLYLPYTYLMKHVSLFNKEYNHWLQSECTWKQMKQPINISHFTSPITQLESMKPPYIIVNNYTTLFACAPFVESVTFNVEDITNNEMEEHDTVVPFPKLQHIHETYSEKVLTVLCHNNLANIRTLRVKLVRDQLKKTKNQFIVYKTPGIPFNIMNMTCLENMKINIRLNEYPLTLKKLTVTPQQYVSDPTVSMHTILNEPRNVLTSLKIKCIWTCNYVPHTSLPNLRKLTLGRTSRNSIINLFSIKLPSLKELSMDYTDMEIQSASHVSFPELVSLRKLSISSYRADDLPLLDYVSDQIEELKLNAISEGFQKILQSMTRFKQLTTLHLTLSMKTKASPLLYSIINQNFNLEELVIHNVDVDQSIIQVSLKHIALTIDE